MLAVGVYLAFVVATLRLARHQLRQRQERRRRLRQRERVVPGEVWDLEAWEEDD